MTLRIIFTVVMGLLILFVTGAGVYGLATEENKADRIGGASVALVLVVCFALLIVWVWS